MGRLNFLQKMYEYLTEQLMLQTGLEFHDMYRTRSHIQEEIRTLERNEKEKQKENLHISNEQFLMEEIQTLKRSFESLQKQFQSLENHLFSNLNEHQKKIENLEITKKDKFWYAK